MRRKAIVSVILLVAALYASVVTIRASAPASSPSAIEPQHANMLAKQASGQQISVIVILNDQVDIRSIRGKNRAEKLRNLIGALKNKSDATQARLRPMLATWKSQGKVQAYTPLWIQNAIAVTGENTVIDTLAQQPEVKSILLDATIPAPPISSQSVTPSSVPEQNLSVSHATDLWNLGYQGQGVVVASMDTGVDYTHPDLNAQWRGGSNSWYDPYGQHPTTPTDLNGHGTWTMGVMVGRDLGGTSIGVAPQASWIAVKIFNDSGSATSSAIHRGFQWLLNPDGNLQTDDAPNVVNNSWTFANPGCDLSFEPDLQALVAVDILPVFAAGNFGPNNSTSASPANNPDAFPVGVTDNNDIIDASSSRGPTSCGLAGPATYPAAVAPGVNIKTTDLYGLYTWVTGTSLAAPHISGALALLLSAFPNLSAASQRAALTSTAFDLGASGADNIYGAGRIDVLRAYNAILNGHLPTATPTAIPTDTPLSPTATATPLPPTATATPLPPTPTPTPSAGGIFADGFESGGLTAWTSAATNNGQLSVTAGAALAGAYGMQANINTTTAMYVADGSPSAEASYHARFYFSPNGISISGGKTHDLFAGRASSGTTLFRVQLRFASGSYQVRAGVRSNNGTEKSTAWYTLSNAPHAVEIAWLAATTQKGSNGSLSLWLDGGLKETQSGITNGSTRLEEVRLGPQGLVSGITGTEYYDAFVSTRTTYIGP